MSTCPRCGSGVSAGANFCSGCGARLSEVKRSPPAPRRPAERRQLTVMFCDIAGSTALSETLDPEDLMEVVRRYQALCAEVIEGFGGRIAQYLGDGLLVYFGHPIAHEDAPERAARAALAILDGLAPLNEGLKQDFGAALELRLGIHTGVVVIGELGGGDNREQLAVGDVTSIAERLQGRAPPGSVVISEATRQLVEGRFETEPLGPQALEGIVEPIDAHRLERPRAVRHRLGHSRVRSPFVGRRAELDVLRQRWQRAERGQGSATLLIADAGIGKSRVVLALEDAIGSERSRLHEAYCSSFHRHSAHHPIVEMLRAQTQIEANEPAAAALAKLRAWIDPSCAPDALPLLAGLLEIPPEAGYEEVVLLPRVRHARTTERLLDCLLPGHGGPPTLLVLEDIHWIDPSTAELVRQLLARLPKRRAMLVMTTRDLESPWSDVAHVHPMRLRPLDPPDARALVEGITRQHRLRSEDLEALVSRTDGVPLFVEELTRMVLDQEALEATGGRGIPTTLRDSLTARLDRVSPRSRELAQLASAIGRQFGRALLGRIFGGDDAELQRGLDELQAARLIHPTGPRGRAGAGPARYAFEHSLIQEAAYASLLKRTRQQVHARIARALGEGTGPRVEAEVLAQHLEAAGPEHHQAAAQQWFRAGLAASVRSSDLEVFDYVPQEVIGHLQRGLKLLGSLPSTPSRDRLEAKLLSQLGASLHTIRGHDAQEVEQIFARAQALCEQLDPTPERFWLSWRVWAFYIVKSMHAQALAVAERLLGSVHELHDDGLELEAAFSVGLSCFFMGTDLERARVLLEQVVGRYDRDRHHVNVAITGQDVGVTSCCVSALLYFQLGRVDVAVQRYERSLALSEHHAHPFSRAYALGSGAWFQVHMGNWALALQHARASLRLSQERGFGWWLAWCGILEGRAHAEQGRPGATARIDQALTEWRATGAGLNVPRFLAVLAEARLAEGEREVAVALLAEAEALAEATGERFFLAEILRARGELWLAEEHPDPAVLDPAEATLRAAIAQARTQGAMAWELRAAMSLARLLRHRGRVEEARDVVVRTRAPFDALEGAEHPDSRRARQLLDELRA